jgi:hypothetical protein
LGLLVPQPIPPPFTLLVEQDTPLPPHQIKRKLLLLFHGQGKAKRLLLVVHFKQLVHLRHVLVHRLCRAMLGRRIGHVEVCFSEKKASVDLMSEFDSLGNITDS